MSDFRRAVVAVVVVMVALPSIASAYTVRIHVHLANAIRDNMVKTWTETGDPGIRLLAPDGARVHTVALTVEHAEAIRDFPEYFRAGSIGPDNTVFPGLTDPSHGWIFAPFSQCQALLDEARTGEERAYALGCFLHGTSDTVAHHLVNFFSGQTFTMFPIDAAEDGELKFSLLNVVRHATVESLIEKALERADPTAFTSENLVHKLPIDLIRRVYLQPNDGGRGLWHWFAGGLVARKNEALQAAYLDGYDPTEDIGFTIEEIKEREFAVDLDRKIIQAYLDFLKSGAPITTLRPGGLAPADYVLLLPEIVEDMRRLLAIAQRRGEQRLAEVEAEWAAEGECSILCPVLFGKVKLYRHLFAPAEDGQPSRFHNAVAVKLNELDKVVVSYLESVEKLSNLIVARGLTEISLTELNEAISPMETAISGVTSFPYEELFPQALVDFIHNVQSLRELLEGMQDLLLERLKEHIVERIREHLVELRAQLKALTPEAVLMIKDHIEKTKQKLRERLSEEKLARLDLNDTDPLAAWPTSVAYMNTFNAVAGVLGNPEVVFPTGPSSFFAGPVSFDASYQIDYSQLALCEDLRAIFYPCGTSTAEMLQSDSKHCETFDAAPDGNPPIECHRHDVTQFADSPDPEACRKQLLEELEDFHNGHVGSYTLAYPPELAANPPSCMSPTIPGINDQGDTAFDRVGNDGPAVEESSSGCTAAPHPATPTAALFLLLLAAIRARRAR